MCVPAYVNATATGGDVSRLTTLTQLRRVRDRIDREYALPLDVEALARSVAMAPAHLSRGFRHAYGESPYRYLVARRLERGGTEVMAPPTA
jgi:AraC-like DNA-binding protein